MKIDQKKYPALSALVTSVSKKYEHIDFKPPEGVAKAAKRGLELHKKYGRGGTSVGVARAVQLSKKETVSPETARRMYKYFARHQSDNLKEINPPSNGYIAWMLWGGNPGRSWANKLWKQMKAADEK